MRVSGAAGLRDGQVQHVHLGAAVVEAEPVGRPPSWLGVALRQVQVHGAARAVARCCRNIGGVGVPARAVKLV
eukprot:16378840-Heterocapsa_arctica.AAC.1